MSFAKLFSSVLLAALLCQVIALPSGISSEGDANNVGIPGHYYPKVVYETYGEGTDLPSGLAKGSMEETAVSFAMHKLSVNSDQVVHRAGFSSDIIDHAYLSQVHNGIPFANAVANVAIKDSKVVAFGFSFVKIGKIAASEPSVDTKAAIAAAEAALDCIYDSHPTSLQYLANADGSASLVHVIQVKNDAAGKYYQAHVDAHSGKLLSTVNFVSEATYLAVPITKNSIMDGQSRLVDPQDLTASPVGWHTETFGPYNVTRGNNGYAYRDKYYAIESSRGAYAYRYNSGLDPDVGDNHNASIVNAFYVLGKVHDFTYRYGFTEKAFNFQSLNFGLGGQQHDSIGVSVNDRSAYDNAYFTTYPDGQAGICKLHLFTRTRPLRSTAMENSVVVHEFGHGVSNRLVGGGTASCLTSLESKGLGEGWSDALADWTQQTSASTKDFTIGSYVTNTPNGFRQHPYSTDMRINPRKYSDVGKFNQQHAIGEVWANMLHKVYAELVATYGHAQDAMTSPNKRAGNVIYMHLFIDSLSLIPCHPDFLAARKGFIQADANRYKGQNRCLLWKAFASRGLGYNARPYVDNDDLPSGC